MRKHITGAPESTRVGDIERGWLDLERIATVEVTSEEPGFPIESVFSGGRGWRASGPGEQTIRLMFDQPVALRRIQLRFEETEVERTQQFTLRWSRAGGPATEIVRQQWNFSPAGSTTQVEEYGVELDGVSVLELVIRPDISGREVRASLAAWRVG